MPNPFYTILKQNLFLSITTFSYHIFSQDTIYSWSLQFNHLASLKINFTSTFNSLNSRVFSLHYYKSDPLSSVSLLLLTPKSTLKISHNNSPRYFLSFICGPSTFSCRQPGVFQIYFLKR